MKTQDKNWLLLGGALSGYTFDLFETVASLGGIDVRFLCDPLDGLPSFQHEQTAGRATNCLWWKDASWSQIRKFVQAPRPDAVFVYGNRPRVKINIAMTQLPSATPVFYAADTNIVDLVRQPVKAIGRRITCAPIVRRATAALSLGITNRLALQALGFRSTIELPVYAVDFAALDGAAASGSGADSVADEGEIVVLIVARLTPVKNLPGFVGALAKESDLLGRIRLIIAGEGPDRGALEEIQRTSPDLKMELLGPIPRQDIGALFRRADALLLPSTVEPWGIVVVEALGMGLPVIATPAVGAALSLAGYSGAVLLSTDTEPQSVVAVLRRYVDQRDRLAAVARECMPYIRAHYDRVAVAEAMLRLVYGDS
jgi:glycosyltransferase involved in cell wall biosynthesis